MVIGIRKSNGDDNMIKLTILNETGHTELVMSASEVIEQIETHPTDWVFVDGEMVSRENISEVNWDSVESVVLTPAIVGGL
jgi:hypothetical protein|tara:strand:- start:3109 stop:3351 length:243 start_codon:yes stop_codon:yes gene_type:complete